MPSDPVWVCGDQIARSKYSDELETLAAAGYCLKGRNPDRDAHY
jgi:hypothetical protein